MSDPEDSFAALLSGLHAGDEAAARRVFDCFYRPLVAATAKRLDDRLRARVDPESVVQSCLGSFFGRARAGAFAATEGWAGLWGLLLTIAGRKCANRRRFHGQQVRDVGREQAGAGADWYTGGPAPEDHALLEETTEQALAGLPELGRRVVEESLLGHTPTEIAARLGCSLRYVHLVRTQVRKRLEAMIAGRVGPT